MSPDCFRFVVQQWITMRPAVEVVSWNGLHRLNHKNYSFPAMLQQLCTSTVERWTPRQPNERTVSSCHSSLFFRRRISVSVASFYWHRCVLEQTESKETPAELFQSHFIQQANPDFQAEEQLTSTMRWVLYLLYDEKWPLNSLKVQHRQPEIRYVPLHLVPERFSCCEDTR